MSAGRKKQDSLDRYDTPPDVTRAFLHSWPHMVPMRVWEPAAGKGMMSAALIEHFGPFYVISTDVEPRDDAVGRHDFLKDDALVPKSNLDLIITNPPFNQAQAFADRALKLSNEGGYVALLLRLAFLESVTRAEWLHANMPEDVYVLSKRPSFTGKGTDSTAYAWFVWRKGERTDHFEGHIL